MGPLCRDLVGVLVGEKGGSGGGPRIAGVKRGGFKGLERTDMECVE